MGQSKILVRGEGGLGDCLLSNRFIPAIREYHDNCHITFGFDNYRGESYQLNVLNRFYPNMSNIYCLWNEVDENDFDYFYDLHIDKMKWTTYDFDWLSRFYYFPKTEVSVEKNDYVCLHLTHNLWEPKNLKKEYITIFIFLCIMTIFMSFISRFPNILSIIKFNKHYVARPIWIILD